MANPKSPCPPFQAPRLCSELFFLQALRQIDERYGNYGSAIELCMQVRRSNRKIVVLRGVTAIHEKLPSPMSRSALEGDRVAGAAVFLGKHYGFVAGLLYRAKCALVGLFYFSHQCSSGGAQRQVQRSTAAVKLDT